MPTMPTIPFLYRGNGGGDVAVRLGYNAGISSCCRFIDSTVSSKSGQTVAPRRGADWSMSCVPMATSLSVGVCRVVVRVGDGYRVVVGCRVWVSTFRVALEGASIRTERSYLVRACSRSGSDLRVMPVSAASQPRQRVRRCQPWQRVRRCQPRQRVRRWSVTSPGRRAENRNQACRLPATRWQ